MGMGVSFQKVDSNAWTYAQWGGQAGGGRPGEVVTEVVVTVSREVCRPACPAVCLRGLNHRERVCHPYEFDLLKRDPHAHPVSLLGYFKVRNLSYYIIHIRGCISRNVSCIK